MAHFKVNNNLGICYLNLGNEDKAIAHFKIGYEKKSPNSDLACRNRALASLLEERPLEGLPFIEEALEIKPNSIQNINMKVSLLRAAGRDDDALGLYLEGGDSNAN